MTFGELVPAALRILDAARERGVEVKLPVDTVAATSPDAAAGQVVPATAIPADRMGLDIGPATVESFAAAIRQSRTVVWNGPMGKYEDEPYSRGTREIAEALAASKATTIVGGGETAEAVEEFGFADKMTHVSTGGGAFLEYVEGTPFAALGQIENRD